jgi:hypothetical protein
MKPKVAPIDTRRMTAFRARTKERNVRIRRISVASGAEPSR